MDENDFNNETVSLEVTVNATDDSPLDSTLNTLAYAPLVPAVENKEDEFLTIDDYSEWELSESDFNRSIFDESDVECDVKPRNLKGLCSDTPGADLNNPPAYSSSAEKFLCENPTVFIKFCGLPCVAMFKALLEYVQDEMNDIPGVTKFEQLFSVLVKLHKNEDNLYTNKYIFPPIYVYTVELLSNKLTLVNNSLCESFVPETFMPEFDASQKIVIIGTVTVNIEDDSECLTKHIKYLVGYKTCGEVFFVSKQFSSKTKTLSIIKASGLLERLEHEHWILFYNRGSLSAVQVKKNVKRLHIKDTFYRITSEPIELHVGLVINRITVNFKVLTSLTPICMTLNHRDGCFLDRLVSVCCMIQNMMPKVINK